MRPQKIFQEALRDTTRELLVDEVDQMDHVSQTDLLMERPDRVIDRLYEADIDNS